MSSATYLGEFPVSDPGSLPQTSEAWALLYIDSYGQIDGAHHKAWVLDQVARILLGTPVVACEARWADHPPEIRFVTGAPSVAYLAWVEAHRAGGTYGYDEGIAP